MTSAPTEISNVDPRARSYDLGAWLYDWVVGSTLYHRFVWGMHPGEHGRFAEHALREAPPGEALDAGCGSLLFTAQAYRDTARALTLYDGSQGMLHRARKRLGPSAAESRIRFQRGDLYTLPFTPGRFASAFHFGALHCLDRPEHALAELARVTEPGGALFLSCLVLGRKRGDAFLARLRRAGHVAPARSIEEVVQLVSRAGFRVGAARTLGSFLFLEALRQR